MIKYVAGLYFCGSRDPNKPMIALIKKTRPAWQAGRHNAIGGHIKPGESPIQAMVREFREETGADLPPDRWKMFARLDGTKPDGEGFQVWWFVARHQGEEILPMTQTDEVVTYHVVTRLPDTIIPNVKWLIEMARKGQEHDWPFLVAERTGLNAQISD